MPRQRHAAPGKCPPVAPPKYSSKLDVEHVHQGGRAVWIMTGAAYYHNEPMSAAKSFNPAPIVCHSVHCYSLVDRRRHLYLLHYRSSVAANYCTYVLQIRMCTLYNNYIAYIYNNNTDDVETVYRRNFRACM